MSFGPRLTSFVLFGSVARGTAHESSDIDVLIVTQLNKNDDMDAGQRQQFDTRFNKPLTLDVTDKVIVALERKTDDPNVERDLRSFFETARVDTLKQSVYLITQGNGRVEIKEYHPRVRTVPARNLSFHARSTASQSSARPTRS